ncbi:MAG: hypothetical protein IT328_17550 [Caldilineaceae bacterium]|nr:hypothetical protein [Caldilineaceae bacterium]
MARQPAFPGASSGSQLNRSWQSALRLWRALTAPVAEGDLTLSSSATINAQFWFSQFPLRPTAAWAAVAALLAAGSTTFGLPLGWRELALLLLLVDPLWGAIWRLAAGRLELLPLREGDVPSLVWLPYLEPGSPAARLLGWDDKGVLHLIMRVALPSALLAVAIALTLSPAAVWLTGVILALGLAGWIVRHTVGYVPAALHSAATIGIPWALTLMQLGMNPQQEFWTYHVVLVLLWFIHNWGEGRLLRAPTDLLGICLLAASDLGLALLLVVARAPLWLALMSVLWLPTWLLIYQRRPLQRLNFWWLLSMLISGLALGQSLIVS